MYFLRNTIIVLLLLTLAAIAVVGVMVEAPTVANFTPDRINALGRSVLTVMRPGYLLFTVWVVILLATLLVFFITVATPRRRMKIEVQMGGGRVIIMDAAIKKYIRNALAEIGEISVKKIDLRDHRGQVSTNIYADVRTRENLPVLERRVISRVRSALAEELGITNLGDVHVYIRNFEVTGRPIKPAPAPAKQPETTREAAANNGADSPLVPSTAALATGATAAAASSADVGLADTFESESAARPISVLDDRPVADDQDTEDIVFTDSGLMTTETAYHGDKLPSDDVARAEATLPEPQADTASPAFSDLDDHPEKSDGFGADAERKDDPDKKDSPFL